MITENGFENLVWYLGIVEDNLDPTNHGRVRVRAFGIHPPVDTNEIETKDLPWAFMVNGTGGKFFSIPDNGDYVFGFFADGRDAQHPFVIGVIHGAHLGMASGGNGEATGYGGRPEGLGNTTTDPNTGERITNPDIKPLPGNTNLDTARSQAETYLGREMSDDEWDKLVRATFAEASTNPRERAAVMGVILNRVKSPLYPDTVTEVLYQDSQFQAVTGTDNNRAPSAGYVADRSQDQLNTMAGAVNEYLPTVDTTWTNFTSEVAEAYGEGTDIGFRDTVRNTDNAEVIGKTVFGTVK